MNTLKQVEANKTEFSPGSIKGAMKAVNAGSKDLWQVEPKNLVVIPGLNPRTDKPSYRAHIRRLADSILAEGFYQHCPIACYANSENQLVVRAGFSRLLAVELAVKEGAQIETVPVVVSQSGVSTEDILVSLAKDNTGEPLSPFELGIVCKRLVGFGHEPEAVAKRLNVSLQYVNDLLSLMAAPLALRELVASEVLSASLAIDMITKYGDKALAKILEAQKAAKAKGKDKVTAKDTSGAKFKKAMKKHGEELYECMVALEKTKAYTLITKKLYARIDAVMEEFEKADDRDESAGGDESEEE